jgi:hypothetical protein
MTRQNIIKLWQLAAYRQTATTADRRSNIDVSTSKMQHVIDAFLPV